MGWLIISLRRIRFFLPRGSAFHRLVVLISSYTIARWKPVGQAESRPPHTHTHAHMVTVISVRLWRSGGKIIRNSLPTVAGWHTGWLMFSRADWKVGWCGRGEPQTLMFEILRRVMVFASLFSLSHTHSPQLFGRIFLVSGGHFPVLRVRPSVTIPLHHC